MQHGRGPDDLLEHRLLIDLLAQNQVLGLEPILEPADLLVGERVRHGHGDRPSHVLENGHFLVGEAPRGSPREDDRADQPLADEQRGAHVAADADGDEPLFFGESLLGLEILADVGTAGAADQIHHRAFERKVGRHLVARDVEAAGGGIHVRLAASPGMPDHVDGMRAHHVTFDRGDAEHVDGHDRGEHARHRLEDADEVELRVRRLGDLEERAILLLRVGGCAEGRLHLDRHERRILPRYAEGCQRNLTCRGSPSRGMAPSPPSPRRAARTGL